MISEKDTEDIEDVMAVIGEGERMDDRVEMNNEQHDWDYNEDRQESWQPLLFLGKAIVQKLWNISVGEKQVDQRKQN